MLNGRVRRASDAAKGAGTDTNRIQERTMRFMVMVKATKESEAGILPKPEAFAAMGKYNAELVKAGVLLAPRGSPRARRVREVQRRQTHRHRWSVHRDERARRGLLDHSGEVAGGSDRVGEARSERLLSERRGGD